MKRKKIFEIIVGFWLGSMCFTANAQKTDVPQINAFSVRQAVEIAHASRVCKQIQVDDAYLWIRRKPLPHEIRADEPGPAGDQRASRCERSHDSLQAIPSTRNSRTASMTVAVSRSDMVLNSGSRTSWSLMRSVTGQSPGFPPSRCPIGDE